MRVNGHIRSALLALLLGLEVACTHREIKTDASAATTSPARSHLIDWAALRNPVLAYADWSVKDYGIAFNPDDQTFYLFFSAFYEDAGRVRSHVVEVATKDFKTYSDPIFNISGMEDGWIGMCSPDVTRVERDGRPTWVVTFNSWGDKEGQPNQLFYMESSDLRHWSPRKPLAKNLTTQRAIDAAIAWANGRYYLAWKEKQTPRLAVGESLDGDFRLVGDGYLKFKLRDGDPNNRHENYQFIRIGDRWRLLVTNMKPFEGPHLYTMAGTGDRDEDWLTWEQGARLAVADEPFNTGSRDNSAVMLDLSAVDGYYYLLYAGSLAETKKMFLGRSHNKLGLSRSHDFENWLPAGRLAP